MLIITVAVMAQEKLKEKAVSVCYYKTKSERRKENAFRLLFFFLLSFFLLFHFHFREFRQNNERYFHSCVHEKINAFRAITNSANEQRETENEKVARSNNFMNFHVN